MTLDEIRKQINETDTQIEQLFIKRMELAQNVAQTKITDASPIFRGDRETEILDRISQHMPQQLKQSGKSLFSSIMLLSRQSQYRYYVENGILPQALSVFSSSAENEDTVCFYGGVASWSNLAAKKLLPKATSFFGAESFEAVFDAVISGKSQCGVLPIENSTAGTVREVYDLLIKHNLYITASTTLDIKYCLACAKGADKSSIEKVFSHTQSLSQCANYLKLNSYKPCIYENTAAAAQFVAKSNNPKYAALCNEIAVEKYSLQVLENDIRDSKINTTRFIKISKIPSVTQDADTISIDFTLAHESGTLSNVLNMFRDMGLSIVKIESRPIPQERFRYSFYLDFKGNIKDVSVQALLLQLESELKEFKILGNYKS